MTFAPWKFETDLKVKPISFSKLRNCIHFPRITLLTLVMIWGCLKYFILIRWKGFPDSSTGKESPLMWETWVQSLGWEDPLEKGTATHSNILAWRLPWTIQRVRHNWATFTIISWKEADIINLISCRVSGFNQHLVNIYRAFIMSWWHGGEQDRQGPNLMELLFHWGRYTISKKVQ